MPPKAAKSRTGSAKPAGDQGLASVLFGEEGNWNASLAFVVGNQIEDYAHISALVAAVKGGTRKLFSSLSREELFSQVLDLGSTKTPRKGKEVPQFSEICEPCKQHLDNGEEIPLPLLAKLIKFKLLDIKNQDVKRREAEKKALEDRDKSSKGKSDKKDRSKSPTKGAKSAAGKGKAPPETTIAKAGSKLRKRGEEDLEAKYINDEPDDGPQQYIIITGFHHPHLISHLSEIGIHIDVIINIISQSYEVSPSPAAEIAKTTTTLGNGPATTATAPAATIVVEDEEKKKKEREQMIAELKKFWQDVLLLMQKAPDSSTLHDVARLEYTVPDSIVPSSAADADAKVAFGSTVFEVVACMLYNLVDVKRQWKNYLANLRLLRVPPVCVTVEPAEGSGAAKSPMLSHSQLKLESAMDVEVKPGLCPVEVDMRRYNDLMNAIPLESVSIPLVMHCMLEQVCAYEAQPDAMQAEKSDYNMEDSLAQHLNTLAFKLALTVEERKILFPDYQPPPSSVAEGNQKQPMLISYHDDLTRRLNHLQPVDGFSPIEAELQMLGYSPASSILSRFPHEPDQRTALERTARFQELLFFCTQLEAVSKSDISRALQQFVLECMILTTVDEHGRICRPQTDQKDIPWDDPYPYYMGMIPDTDERVKSGCVERPDSEANKETENDPEGLSRSGSILRRPDSLGSRKRASSCHSVHFEEDDDGQPVPHPGDDDLDEFKDCPQSSTDIPPENSSCGLSSSLVDLSDVVNNRTKRNLDQWQYAEHMEPSILLQALLRALETHPYVDTYYQKRDNSFLIVLHNPHDPSASLSFDNWQVALHSNVRFRNYLEYVAGGIVEWTQTEEAKHEASLLAAEVAKLQNEDEEPPATPADKRSRSKSPKKADSRGAKSPSSNSVERSTPCESFVRAGSLKAWKEEQARIKAEEEEHARLAEEKRAKSAQKKPGKEARTEDKKPKEKEKEVKKQPDSKSATTVNGTVEQPNAAAAAAGSTQPERYWPFTGYDVGDKLIHVAGVTYTLFPDDGGQIVTERIQYLHGSKSVRASVRKGGHSFTVHVIDPKQMNNEEEGHEAGKEDAGECTAESAAVAGEVANGPNAADTCLMSCDAEVKITEDNDSRQKDCNGEVVEAAGAAGTDQGCELPTAGESPPEKSCVGRFGSFTAQFNDGMTLSVSTFGPSGEPPNGKPYEPEPYTAPVQSTAVSGSTTERDLSPAKRSKTGDKASKDKDKEKLTVGDGASAAPSEAEVKEEVVKETPVVKPFQQLYVTSPDGLNVTYFLEGSVEERRLLVRQSYPFKTKCLQNCDAARKTAMREQSRVIMSDGTVVKTMTDGTTQVLFADGTVSEFCFSSALLPAPLTVVPDPQQVVKEVNISASKKKSSRRGLKADQLGTVTPAEEEMQDKGYWITTLPTGERIANRLNGASVEVQNAVLCVASDPQTLQVMHTREDHVITIYHPDGLVIVEHSDGTRITTKHQLKDPLEEDVTEQQQQRMENEVVTARQEEENQRYTEVGEVKEQMEGEQEMNKFYISNAKEKITEVDEMETNKASVAKFVLVECPGYASVKFDSASGLCSTEFGSGCVVDCMMEGRYDVFHPSGGFLRLDPDGTAVYYDQADGRQSPGFNHQPQYYVMRHFDSIIAETIDRHGTHYIVTNSGENHVNLLSDIGELRMGDAASCEAVSDGRQTSSDICSSLGRRTPQHLRDAEDIHGNHVPRLFVVRCDGSGEELLRSDDVAPYLSAAERDPSSVVLKAPLPNCTDVYGITVLRPLPKNTSQTWLKGYLLDSIIPAGLKSNDLRRRSLGDAKTQSSRSCKSFTLGVNSPLAKVEQVPVAAKKVVCPSILEFRQLIKYNSVSEMQRNKLNLGLKAFADHVKKRTAYYKELSIEDTRTDEERANADELQVRLPTPCATPQLVDDVKCVYEKALTPVERPRITSSAKMRMKKYDLEKVKQELAEERECRNALRLRNISPYFKSELAAGYSNLQNKSALTRQFLGYISCGSPVQLENIEQRNESPMLPPPGITVEHVSPEPEDKSEDGKTTDREIKTPEGNNLSNREMVSYAKESAETETVEGVFDSHEGPPTEYNVFDRLIISDSSVADKETSPQPLSPKAGQYSEESFKTDHLMKPVEDAQKPADDDNLPAFKMPDFKGLLADLMTGSSAEDIEKSITKHEKTPTEKAGNDLKQDSARSKPITKCDKGGLQDFQKDPCAAANDDDECRKLSQKLAASSRPVSNCDDDDPIVVALTKQNACQQNECAGQPDYNDVNVTMDRDFDSAQHVSTTIETSQLDNSKCQSNHPSVPGYMSYGKRPGATPNAKFARVEEPVRRKVNNVIVTGATPVGYQTINRMRGLELAPERVDFGVLKEGNTYTLNLSLRNTGVDACRFRVKQPPPSTGVKILYKPGPVAAGMKTDIQVEIYAIAAGVEGDRGVGLIAHNVEITTETDQMLLPVTATVLTGNEFDSRGPDSPKGGKSPGVKLVSSKPPAGVGLIRPRKHLMLGESVVVN